MSWTVERVEQLKALFDKGLSFAQIARMLGGVSRSAVIGKAHRLDLSDRKGGTNQPITRRPPREAAYLRKPALALVSAPEPMQEPLRIGMLEALTPQCRFPLWPHGESGAPDYPVCGLPVWEGPYCAQHAAVACTPAAVREYRPRSARGCGKLSSIKLRAVGTSLMNPIMPDEEDVA